jgi:hypothetical protein
LGLYLIIEIEGRGNDGNTAKKEYGNTVFGFTVYDTLWKKMLA